MRMMTRFLVDGTYEDGSMSGGARTGPFAVFDTAHQDHVAVGIATREEAETIAATLEKYQGPQLAPKEKASTPLFRTTIVIWTDFNPSEMELDDLAREAISGDAFCSLQEVAEIDNPNEFPATEFFDAPEDESA